MRNARLFKIRIVLAVTVFLGSATFAGGRWASHAAEVDTAYDASELEEINMIVGELVSLEVSGMTRVSIADPAIADIADAEEEEVLVVGKGVGQTALFIWDQYGKRTLMVYVYNQDLDLTKKRIEKLLKTGGINEVTLSSNPQEGKVVISGQIPKAKRDLFDQIVEPFTEEIVNIVADEKKDDLVQIDVQISEINTAESEALGIDWVTGDEDVFAPVYDENYPDDMSPGVEDFLKFGKFQRGIGSSLAARINALAQEGKARILSKPKIVVVNGEEAQFLVGGQVPIRTITSSGTVTQENVTFKDYGTSMTLTPSILKNKKVDIVMNLEVSDIDPSTAATISDNLAFVTRSASTHLLLDDGETIVMAGLIKHSENELRNKLPFVADIPVVGALFRSRRNPTPNVDQELVIALTPHIIFQKNTGDELEANQGPSRSVLGNNKGKGLQNQTASYMGIPKDMVGYVQGIQEKIYASVVYPPEAKDSGWEGTVKMKMLILSDGTLAFALVKDSSGYDIFDEAALRTTKLAAPFPAFPSNSNLQELSITMPIVYSLKRN